MSAGRYRFLQLDVLTERPFSGNPRAVFPEAEGRTNKERQRIAREMNLSETVFVLASSEKKDLRRLRNFTPGRELPFAGHTVVGMWNALAREGVVPLPEGGSGWMRIEHKVGIGRLPVDVEFREGQPRRVVMREDIARGSTGGRVSERRLGAAWVSRGRIWTKGC